jgi:hypothetical protein
MTAIVKLTDEELAELQALTQQRDVSAAVRIAVQEFLRAGRQVRPSTSAESAAGVGNGVHPSDAWMDEVEATAAAGDPEDDQRLAAAVGEIQRREKAIARNAFGPNP